MKKLIRGMSLAAVMVAAAGLSGCNNSNEAEADRLQKSLGPVPETTVKGPEGERPPSVYSDRGKPDYSAYRKSVKNAKGGR